MVAKAIMPSIARCLLTKSKVPAVVVFFGVTGQTLEDKFSERGERGFVGGSDMFPKCKFFRTRVVGSVIALGFSALAAEASLSETTSNTIQGGVQTTETQKISFVLDLEDIYRSVGATQQQIERLRSLNARIQQARKEHNLTELDSLKRERANLLTVEQKQKIVHAIRRHYEKIASLESAISATTETASVQRP